MTMDFALTAEQLDLKAGVTRFAQAELNEGLSARDDAATFNRAGWKSCAARGLAGLPIPARYGGRGADPLTTLAALEGLGQGCRDNGLCFALNAHLWGCASPLLAF